MPDQARLTIVLTDEAQASPAPSSTAASGMGGGRPVVATAPNVAAAQPAVSSAAIPAQAAQSVSATADLLGQGGLATAVTEATVALRAFTATIPAGQGQPQGASAPATTLQPQGAGAPATPNPQPTPAPPRSVVAQTGVPAAINAAAAVGVPGAQSAGAAVAVAQTVSTASQAVQASGGIGAALTSFAASVGPAALVVGGLAIAAGAAVFAVKAFGNWMDRSAMQLERWSGQIASANARAEIIGMQAEQRRAAVLSDEIAKFQVAKARSGSVLSDLGTSFMEPIAGIGAEIMDLIANILEIIKPLAKFTIEVITAPLDAIRWILEQINKVIKAIKEFLLGADANENNQFDAEIAKLDQLYESLLHFPWQQSRMPPNVMPAEGFGGML